MTIDWRYTVAENLGILSVAGYLGSAEGQLAIAEAARRLAEVGRGLELAAIPADGSLVPAEDCPPIPVHPDLAAALAAHSAGERGQVEGGTSGVPRDGRATATAARDDPARVPNGGQLVGFVTQRRTAVITASPRELMASTACWSPGIGAIPRTVSAAYRSSRRWSSALTLFRRCLGSGGGSR